MSKQPRALKRWDLDAVTAAAETASKLNDEMGGLLELVKQIGDLQQRHADLTQGLENLERTIASDARQFEAARDEFAREQRLREMELARLDTDLRGKHEEIARADGILKQRRASSEAA